MNLRKLTAVLALSALAACSKGSPTAPSDIESAPSVSAQEASPVTASSEIWLSTEDRIWFKSHVPKFSVEGTVVSVSGTNRWDVQVRQGSAQEFFLKIFDKQDPSQPFIGQAGPFKIGAKESFSASVDIGFGYCFVEAELRLDTADNKVNGGTPSYLFGAENLDIPGCKKPSTPSSSPSPDPTCEELENCPLPPVDYCLNIEGQQDEMPQGYVRDEAGNCTLIPPPCEEIWTAQEPEITYGEYGECGPILNASSGNHTTSCAKSRTNIVTIYEVSSCTQERRVKSVTEIVEVEACECPAPPEPDYCYYNISGNPIFKVAFCSATGGSWGNWNNQSNHCRYNFPGISSSFAQLTGGQSESGCLSKHDD